MSNLISATTLARQIGDILGRVRYRGESFLIERSGVVIARLGPAGVGGNCSLADALREWRKAAKPDADFAADLERVGAADRAPGDPWGS